MDRQAEARHRRDWRAQPGDRLQDLAADDPPARGLDPGDTTLVGENSGHFGLLVDLDPAPGRAHRVAPGHRVMARDGAGFVVEGAEDRETRAAVEVERRAEPRQLVPVHDLGFDPEMLVDLRPPAHGPQRGVVMGERQVAALGIEDVETELVREVAKQADRLVVEPHPFRRQVVGADDGGVARGIAAAEPALVEHRDIGDPVVLGEVVGGGESVPAGAHDHHVVARSQPDRGRHRAAPPAPARQSVFDQPERHRSSRPPRRSVVCSPAKLKRPACGRIPIAIAWSNSFAIRPA